MKIVVEQFNFTNNCAPIGRHENLNNTPHFDEKLTSTQKAGEKKEKIIVSFRNSAICHLWRWQLINN